MPAEIITHLMRPGFPRESLNSKSYQTTIEYVGPVAELIAASPAVSTVWGLYPGLVTEDSLERFEGDSGYGILTVVCEREFNTGDEAGTGTKIKKETTYEIDWVDVQRSMFEHPEFRVNGGGTHALTEEDVLAISSWEKNPYIDYKKIFSYRDNGDYTEPVSAADPTLSANAQMFAQGILLGVEFYVDKAPIAIRSDTYVNGPPPAGTAGQKETPPGFPNLPTGYEWIRGADRALRAGGQSRWSATTDWIGAKKVLVDVDEVFWAAP